MAFRFFSNIYKIPKPTYIKIRITTRYNAKEAYAPKKLKIR